MCSSIEFKIFTFSIIWSAKCLHKLESLVKVFVVYRKIHNFFQWAKQNIFIENVIRNLLNILNIYIFKFNDSFILNQVKLKFLVEHYSLGGCMMTRVKIMRQHHCCSDWQCQFQLERYCITRCVLSKFSSYWSTATTVYQTCPPALWQSSVWPYDVLGSSTDILNSCGLNNATQCDEWI